MRFNSLGQIFFIGVYLMIMLISSNTSKISKLQHIQHILHDIHYHRGFLMIDGDNCRGKVSFHLTKQKLASLVYQWVQKSGCKCRTVLYFDHGREQGAYYYYDPNDVKKGQSTSFSTEAYNALNPILISFSGVSLTVDDCIVKDLKYIQNVLKKDVCIVTEDRELRSRCRKNTMDSAHSNRSRKKAAKLNRELKLMSVGHPLGSTSDAKLNRKLGLLESTSFMEFLYSVHDMDFEATKRKPHIDVNPAKLYQNVDVPVASRGMGKSSQNSAEENGLDCSMLYTRNDKVNYILEQLFTKQSEYLRKLQLLNETYVNTTSSRIKMKLTYSINQMKKLHEGSVSTYQRVYGWFQESNTPSGIAEDTELTKLMDDFDICDEGTKLFERLLNNGRAINPIGVNGAEETWERVILAEKFRQELLQLPPFTYQRRLRKRSNALEESGNINAIERSLQTPQEPLNDNESEDEIEYIEASVIDALFPTEISEDKHLFEMNAYIDFVKSMSHLQRFVSPRR